MEVKDTNIDDSDLIWAWANNVCIIACNKKVKRKKENFKFKNRLLHLTYDTHTSKSCASLLIHDYI